MNITRAFLFLSILIFFSCQSNKNKQEEEKSFVITNKSVLDLKDSIANFNEVQSSHISYAGTPSSQYKNYKNLVQIASIKELYQLTKDTNNVVATYASFGLIDKESPKFIDVFERFLKTDKKVQTMKGCIIGSDLVYSEIYFKYWNKLHLSTEDEKVTFQKDAQLLKLDSLVLATDNVDWLLIRTVFKNRIFDSAYLPLIEKQAFHKENIEAINYIFKHHKTDYEKQLISALKNYLKRKEIIPMYYEDIFTMMHSFQKEELDALLIQELGKIETKYGKSSAEYYKKMLQ